jgi:GntR family transcriptional regulator/MocR family aminotransferase
MLRPWDLHIVLERDDPVPAWQQIANVLIEAIRRGRLPPGTALPGTRDLAARIGVNRKTVQQSYDELVAQGWLTTEATRGTFVSALLPVVEAETLHTPQPLPSHSVTLRGKAPDLHLNLGGPNMLVFDDGAPDTRLIPAELMARAYRRALLGASRRNQLGYGNPCGTLALREAIAAMLRTDRGLDCSVENVCITRGSQMGIFLSARLFATAGDSLAIEQLSYPPAREAFAAAGANIISFGMDTSGMLLDELETICKVHPPNVIYITPHHQFPTAIVLPQERRVKLLALAELYDFVIIEDDYDHEFHYTHRPMLPLASAYGFSRLAYIGSLSKLLSPSLRIGYLVGSPAMVARAGTEICLIDRQGDPATEIAVAELMTSGALKSHARKVLRIYQRRGEFLVNLLKQELGDQVSVMMPAGGLALWANFIPAINTGNLAKHAAALGLVITPGQAFVTNGHSSNGLRLGFGSMNEAELTLAVHKLKEAARKCTS